VYCCRRRPTYSLDAGANLMMPIRVVRSWPKEPYAGNPRCDDLFFRVMTDPYDYAPLADLGSNVIHLDWDMAVSVEDLRHFAEHARTNPDRCLVGPYKLYPGGINHGTPRDHKGELWAAFRYAHDMSCRWNVGTGDPTCDQFGFGMVYLPAWSTAGFVAECPDVLFDDIGFSSWYTAKVGPADICWHVRPVHINYPPPATV
jgi:hypothetical protein